ncbi:mucin-binding protein [Ligilactobacillus sp. LYQ60]|uniref:mucin-binding protein n=1 Tax=Ligilactobacillus sp. LYQ60 TaxID=3378799 RepID=UPI00385360D4
MRNKTYLGDKIRRVKLYKKGKMWVAAAITFLTVGVGRLVQVNADQANSVSESDEQVTTVSKSSSSESDEQATTVSKSSSSESVENGNSQVSSNSTSVETGKQTTEGVRSTVRPVSENVTSVSANSSSVTTTQSSQDSQEASTPVEHQANNENTKEAQSNVASSMLPVAKAMPLTLASTSSTDDPYDDPYYGTWTFFFSDDKGNTLYYPVGCTNKTSDQAETFVTPYVKMIEARGYTYVGDQGFTYNAGSGYAYNYNTLIFKKNPLVQGGAVTVKYVDASTGEVLQTGTATYTDDSGNTSSTPYVGYTYTTKPVTITGYTLSKTPSNATGKVTSSAQTVTYEYTPNQETAKIQIIDETDGGKVLTTINVNGTYGKTSSYDINSYLNSNYPNYDVASNNWPGSITWDSTNDGTVPEYQVKLTHKTQTGTQTKVVTQTIKYQYADGTQAEPTKTTTITFTRPETTDLVTGNVTYGLWTNETGTDEFPAVQSPQIPGYTASYSESSPVTGVTADSPDNTQTIVYVANKEEMTIVYYDMDEHKILQEKILQGDYNTSPDYDYQSVLKSFEDAGYNVAKNTIPASGLKFDNTGDQHYEIDLTHTTTKLPADSEGLTKVITHTIHYVDSSGKTVAPDVVQSITYTRGATKDNVTGAITYTDWTTTTDPAEFPSVTSPTVAGYTPSQTDSGVVPVDSNSSDSNETIVYSKNGGTQTPTGDTSTVTETINYINSSGVVLHAPTTETITFEKGTDGTYTAVGSDDFPAITVPTIEGYTPNVTTIPAVDGVKATDANIEKTVVYSPVQSSITITYYDETSKKTLRTDTLSGNYNASPDYDATTLIDGFEKNGYAEVSSNVPSSLIYTNSPQSYTVVLKHTYTTSTQTATVTQTINYNYANGQQAAPSVNKQLSFSRTQTKDNVTGDIQNSTWTPSAGEFPAVTSPTITGYTPSKAQSEVISNVDGSTTNNVQNIVYTANQEKITVNYIDQTTGKTITTDTLTGAYDTTSSYTTASEIAKLESQGYVLVQDNYPSSGAKFDEDGVVKSYDVVLKENVTTSTESKTINQVIHYVDQNGKTIAPDKDSSVTFTRTVSTNKVTGVQTDGAWTPTTEEFPAVTSPTITGYTVIPGEETSQAVSVDPTTGDNTQTITYTANQERAQVEYIDGTDNSVMSSVTLSGAYGTTDSYNPAATIQQYIDKGYKLSSDEFPASGVVYNYDGTVPVYKIVFEHNTRTDSVGNNPDNVSADELTHTVHQTIHYVYSDGSQAASDATNSLTFNRSVTVDQVTHEVIAEGDWTPSTQTFPAVTSPTITGYTPSATQSSAVDVTESSADDTQTITYTANKEHAAANTDHSHSDTNGTTAHTTTGSSEKHNASNNTVSHLHKTSASTEKTLGQEQVKQKNANNSSSTVTKAALNNIQGQSSSDHGQTENHSGVGKLPDTGNAANHGGILGALLIVFANLLAFLGWGDRKKKKE